MSLTSKAQTIKTQVDTIKETLSLGASTPLEDINTSVELTVEAVENVDVFRVSSTAERDLLPAKEGDICVVYENSYKPVIPNLNFNVFQFPDSVTLSQAVQQSNAYFQMVDESEGYVSVDFSIYEGAKIMGFVELDGDYQEFNITYTTSDNITFTKSSATGEGIITGNIVTLPKEIYLSEPNNEVGNFIKVEQPNFVGIFQYDGSIWDNLDVGLNAVANDIIIGTKAYSNDGVLIGALGNTISSNFNDNIGKLYGIAQAYYNTLTPIVAPANSSDLYSSSDISIIPCKSDGTPLLDTSNVTNAKWMFKYCRNLQTIPLLDFNNVTSLDGIFDECRNLKNISLLKTTKVISFQNMFSSCSRMQSVPLLDTSSATSLASMFHFCKSLTTIPQFNTQNVKTFSQTFNGCENLQSVPLLDTSSATDMTEMFKNCKTLTTVPQFNTSIVTNMMSMFNGCTSLNSVPLFDTSSVSSFNAIFNNCASLTSIPQFNTSNVTNMVVMFAGCTSLTTVPLLNTSKVTNMARMFENCPNLTDTSLNNILAMCKNSVVSSNKTLANLGFTEENYSISRIQALSNYSAFVNAGWSIGY